jgi:hypothetical protein
VGAKGAKGAKGANVPKAAHLPTPALFQKKPLRIRYFRTFETGNYFFIYH